MLKRWHVLGIAIVLLVLSGAVSSGLNGSTREDGTAGAAQTANPVKTLEELFAAVRELPPGEWRIPIIWAPAAGARASAWARYKKRVQAAEFSKLLKVKDWTCDAAFFLDTFQKIDSASKSETVEHVYQDTVFVGRQEIKGFIDRAAQLGRWTVVQSVNAACP